MGNEQSCCQDINEKGQIQSNANSLKYGSVIYNAQNHSIKVYSKSNKQVFTGSKLESSKTSSEQNQYESRKNSKAPSHLNSNMNIKYQDRQIQMKGSNDSELGKKLVEVNRHQQQPYVQSEVWSFKKPSHSNKPSSYRNKASYSNQPFNQQVLAVLKRSDYSEESYQNAFRSIEGSNNQAHRNSIQTEPLINTASWVDRSSVREQIVIEYLPAVKKVIEQQKHFESQLSLVPKSNIKTRRYNNGKDIYKGQINYVFLSLNQYEKPHGYGVFVKQNGSVLIGKFDNGVLNGKAYFIFSDGSFYRGHMLNNKAHDQSGQFHSATMSYRGAFRDNLFHGNGQEIGCNYCFKGVFQNHRRKKGVLKWNPKSLNNPEKQSYNYSQSYKYSHLPRQWIDHQYDFVYEGDFDNEQQFTGKGKLKDLLGQYEGDFVQGKKHGKGVYFYDNKLKYIGEYHENNKQGYGKLYNCDDTLAYEGAWKNNLPHGKGCSYDPQGKPHQLQFIQGISTILAPE